MTTTGEFSAERAQLGSRDRDELHEIASAMGVRGATRLRKADLIEAILDKATSGESVPEPTGEKPKKRATRKKATDAEAHRSHFLARAHDNRSRPSDRYLEFFDNIRKIQRYVKSLALERNVPIVPSYSLDATLAHVIELVVSRAMAAVPTGDASANGSGPKDLQTASARRTHDR